MNKAPRTLAGGVDWKLIDAFLRLFLAWFHLAVRIVQRCPDGRALFRATRPGPLAATKPGNVRCTIKKGPEPLFPPALGVSV